MCARPFSLLFWVAVMSGAPVACGDGGAQPSARPARGAATKAESPVAYVDVTAGSGIDFVHENGSFGRKWLPETMGSGAALLDFDSDGKLDVLFVNQRRWPGHESEYAAPASRPATLRLFRNQGGLKFEDATERAGLAVSVFGMGAAAADVDGDGDPDLVVTALGDLLFFRNDGGRFVECAKDAGLATPRWRDKDGNEHPLWSTAAAFLDYDRDGVLDLFVAAYVKWSEKTDIFATLDGTTKAFTTPDLYPGDSSRLYRGLGAGRFEDVTDAAGVRKPDGKSLGVAVADLDDDGAPDLVVANDTQPNFLYRNEGGRFRDLGLESGIAYDASGRARAGMGIDAARPEGAGPWTIAIANFSREPLSLFRERPKLTFSDDAGIAGLAEASFLPLKFGLAFLDADLDGRLDVALANGHIEPTIQATQSDVPYAQAPQLFWNRGGGRFDDVSKTAGLTRPLVGRGLAAGDLDGDGDSDLVLT
ncbi:MAG TPA: VCBS repeat-containing protein, partial [Planctomycetota bacterium]|nr:VCBS repeat-containing protein [Planctomycetota bacterium]